MSNRPIPSALYPCSYEHCECSWDPDELNWSEAMKGWFCEQCWSDEYGDPGPTLAHELGARASAPVVEGEKPIQLENYMIELADSAVREILDDCRSTPAGMAEIINVRLDALHDRMQESALSQLAQAEHNWRAAEAECAAVKERLEQLAKAQNAWLAGREFLQGQLDALRATNSALVGALEEAAQEASGPVAVSYEYDATPTAEERLARIEHTLRAALAQAKEGA